MRPLLPIGYNFVFKEKNKDFFEIELFARPGLGWGEGGSFGRETLLLASTSSSLRRSQSSPEIKSLQRVKSPPRGFSSQMDVPETPPPGRSPGGIQARCSKPQHGVGTALLRAYPTEETHSSLRYLVCLIMTMGEGGTQNMDASRT